MIKMRRQNETICLGGTIMTKNAILEEFMKINGGIGLTFDDVSLVTQYADFLPDEADITTKLTRNIKLNIPFVSAAMDTVTEANMAVAMAMQGGIGIIHKNLDPITQASDVATVKRHLHGLIVDPVVFKASDTVEGIKQEIKGRGFSFSGFPVVNEAGNVVGIVTAADLKFAESPESRAADVMTQKVVTAPPKTTLQQAYELMKRHKIGKLPLVEDGKLLGLYSYSDVRTLVENIESVINRDSQYRLRVGAAIGPGDQKRVEALVDEEVDVLVVDTAHGHSKGVIDMVRWSKKHYPEIDIIAGNIGTAEAASDLMKAGADAVKVGIGPGSVCTTRVVCGVGVPQITAIYEACSALKGEIPVIADGGIRQSGDVPKALVAGADSIMMGSVLAGSEESPGEKIIHQGRQYVVYRGMGSLSAMKEGTGSRDRYAQKDAAEEELVPQGVEGIVPYAGSLKKVLTQYAGGLRSALGYSGTPSIAELQKRGRFGRISYAALTEAHPHDVKIMREAPNYRSS